MRPQTSHPLKTRHRVCDGTLVIDLGRARRVLSSAPCGGGLRSARFIINHQVEAGTGSSVSRVETEASGKTWQADPSVSLRAVAAQLGLRGPLVGLMTAVPMKQLVARHLRTGRLWVECFATVGVTNAVRAGEPLDAAAASDEAHNAGTINIIVVTNAALASSAMVGAIQVVTESKTGVLRDRAVSCWTGRPGATGTGTDAVVMVCAHRGEGPWQRYSGMHTGIGTMIGQVVADCVRQGLDRASRWAARAGGQP